jgi:hypothetical protein
MQPPIALIDRIIRLVMINSVGWNNGFDLVVQNICAAIVIDYEDSMGEVQIKILENHDAKLTILKSQ